MRYLIHGVGSDFWIQMAQEWGDTRYSCNRTNGWLKNGNGVHQNVDQYFTLNYAFLGNDSLAVAKA